MPRYYFHVSLEGTLLSDPGGRQLPDADAAWEQARTAALDLMRTDFGQPVNWARCHFEVTDETGEIVLENPFTEAIEMNTPPQWRRMSG
jgi:hypothetical protein